MKPAPDIVDAIDHLIETSDTEPMHLRKFYGRQHAINYGLRACRSPDTIICMAPRCQRAGKCRWRREG